MSSLPTIRNDINLDTMDIIIIVLIFFIYIYIIRTHWNQKLEYFTKNDLEEKIEIEINEDEEMETVKEKEEFHFVEIAQSILYPKYVQFSCHINGQTFYLGYIPSGQCVSNFETTEELHTLDCQKYNIVIETLEESNEHKNTSFNISIPSGNKKYDYMIGAPSVFNKLDYVQLSSHLLMDSSVTNLCGDIGIGTHSAWNVNIIQKSAGTKDIPPTFNLCFIVHGELFYITYAEENVEPCFFNFIKNNTSKNTVLHKAALTKDKLLALNFIITSQPLADHLKIEQNF